MWKYQNVISTFVIIILVSEPNHMLLTYQQNHLKVRTNYKLPVSFPKEIVCRNDLTLLKCALTCQEMSKCYMFCFNSGMCAMAQLGNGYIIHTRDNQDECHVNESITYTCYKNQKMNDANAEEQVFALGLTNVALGKPAKVQKDYVQGSNSSAFLVDGNLARTYQQDKKLCVDSEMNSNAWVWIDLRETYHVFAINITNNDNDLFKRRFHHSVIRVGMNGDTSLDAAVNFESNPICFKYNGIADDFWMDFCHPEPIPGRYVTLQISEKCRQTDNPDCYEENGNVINLCEMQVFVLNN